MALPAMGDQFRGLPMADLIGGPLMAACDAQVKLANATADFIKVVGFLPPTGTGNTVKPNRLPRSASHFFRRRRRSLSAG